MRLEFIPVSDVDRLREALRSARKEAEIVLYGDVAHGFMNEERPSYHPARATEAWEKTIQFFRKHLG